MIIVAIVVFATVASGGVVLAAHVLRNELAPWMLSMGHALLGATGISILGYVLARVRMDNTVMVSLSLFVIAAMGGFTLASYHMRRRLPPRGAVILHATMAVSAFLVLISLVLRL